MTAKQVKSLISGTALLEYCGNLYEFIGMEIDKYLFQSLNDDRYIKAGLKSLINNKDYIYCPEENVL